MPLYEYLCEACHRRFELIRKFSDPELQECTLCGKGPVQRLISSPAIQFKGSGWYITDYAGGRSSAASSTGTGDSDAKSESKKDGDKKPAGESAAKSDSGSTTTTPSTSKE